LPELRTGIQPEALDQRGTKKNLSLAGEREPERNFGVSDLIVTSNKYEQQPHHQCCKWKWSV